MYSPNEVFLSLSIALPSLSLSRSNSKVNRIISSEDFSCILDAYYDAGFTKFDFSYDYDNCHVGEFLRVCFCVLRYLAKNFSLELFAVDD